jgi:RND family efflux transporter MFP subunit
MVALLACSVLPGCARNEGEAPGRDGPSAGPEHAAAGDEGHADDHAHGRPLPPGQAHAHEHEGTHDHGHDEGHDHEAEPHPDAEAITFTREQQRRLDFGTGLVAEAALEQGLPLPGTVRPASGREVSVTAPASGRLALGAGRLPRLGSLVRAGEVLAVLTPSELFASQDRAGLQAAVTAAEAVAAQAQRELARAERLRALDAVPLRRLEEARVALQVAESQRQAAQDHLREKLATLGGGTGVSAESFALKAPISGTVVEARVVPGAYVEGGAELYHVVDLRRVWVEARAPEAELARVAGARRADIAVAGAAPVRVGEGAGGLVAVGGVLDAGSRTAPVVFEVPNAAGLFRIGMSAKVRVLLGKGPATPVVPRTAVVDDQGRPVAYVARDAETFERRALTLGVAEGDRIAVTAGLRAGERVVVRGAYELRLATLSQAVPAHGHEH